MFIPAVVEQIRWFDYWLKGIDNGIMDEPPVRYHVMKGPFQNEWRVSDAWPLPSTRKTEYFFRAGPSGSVRSANDGLLALAAPDEAGGQDDYMVDYATTSGSASRWDNTVGGGFLYPDMTGNDHKSLTYTTSVLAADVEVTGHPVVHLWASSMAADGDFFVFLEEVDTDGISHYVTEGTLRASYRTLHRNPHEPRDLPWHRGNREDTAKLEPGEPVELVFDMQPTSNVFDAGHRIRLAIACADADNAETPELSPPPTVTVYRDVWRASHVILPVIEPVKKAKASGE